MTPVGRSNNDIIYTCPQCDDKSGHLYVNYDKGYFHCFKCGLSGKRMEGLLRVLHIDINYDYTKLYSEKDKEIDSIISMKETKKSSSNIIPVDYSTSLDTLTKYYELHTVPLSLSAHNYLIARGLSEETIRRLEIKEGLNRYGEKFIINSKEFTGRDYSGRIMVPSLRRDGRISFYVGRDYIGDKPAKYMNPPKELGAASEDVWNLDMIESDSVIICEGVFTAIAASPFKLNAVATYGKSISKVSSNDSGTIVTSQGEKLLNKKFKNYYVAYDADAHKEAIQSCDYLYDRGANVYLILIDPKKYGEKADVADIGYDEFMKLMKDAIHYDGGLSSLTL